MKIKKLYLDLETTGTDYRIHGIHQIAGMVEIDGEVWETFNWRVRPHPRAQVTPEALAVCGVDELDLLGYPPMQDVYRAWRAMLETYVDPFDRGDKLFMVGYNINWFDAPFLRMWMELCGDHSTGAWFWAGNIDVMALAAEFLIDVRHEMPSFKLARVAKTVGLRVDPERTHDAMYDIELTRDIYQLIRSKQ